MSPHPLNLSLTFSQPSFHPTLQLTLHPASPPLPLSPASGSSSGSACTPAAHLALTLPDGLFVDPDELGGKWTVGKGGPLSGEASLVRWGIDPPRVDVERPAYGVPPGPEERHTLSMVVRPPRSGDTTGDVLVEVPLHTRYLAPSEEGWRTVMFPGEDGSEIRAGWVCEEDVIRLGAPAGSLPLVHPPHVSITLPTGLYSHQTLVEIGTPLVIWLGWGWIAWKVLKLYRRSGPSGAKAGKASGGGKSQGKVKAL
ncbi:hypothetical protein IAT38_005783 [Cryptococcus sp. DSM 104549]